MSKDLTGLPKQRIEELKKLQSEKYDLLNKRDELFRELNKYNEAYKLLNLRIWGDVSEAVDKSGKKLFTNDKMREQEVERIKREEPDKYKVGGMNHKEIDKKKTDVEKEYYKIGNDITLKNDTIETMKIYLKFLYEGYKEIG